MNYNSKAEGRITKEFLLEITKDVPKYLIVKGYFNLEQSLTLQDMLNFMWEKNYRFVRFLTNERNIEGEIIFERKEKPCNTGH